MADDIEIVELPDGRLASRKRGGELTPLAPEIERIFRAGRPHVASGRELAAYEARQAREARKERLERSGIIVKLEARRMLLADELYPTPPLVAVQRWLVAATGSPGAGPNWLFLCGGMGAGKSVSAAWALSRQEGIYTTLETYLRDYRRYLDDRSPMDRADIVRDRYARAGLLVVDELGTETDAVLMRAALQWLVEHRNTRRRHLTITITNMPKDEVLNRFRLGIYDVRTWDRLKADAAFVSVDGQSMRRPAPGNEQ